MKGWLLLTGMILNQLAAIAHSNNTLEMVWSIFVTKRTVLWANFSFLLYHNDIHIIDLTSFLTFFFIFFYTFYILLPIFVNCFASTICPRCSDPFYIVGYYIKCVTTSWTYSIYWKATLPSRGELPGFRFSDFTSVFAGCSCQNREFNSKFFPIRIILILATPDSG